ncbi:putative aminoadipate reductase [Mycena alexandri]|uniref:Aminoadipate reductase n=1 Tax=Mycena alexandri TaxID=1745969 RepID=A0AAD6TGT3_9AGAR|nr:putative aminoadipate reductase [Mycena alexandri]
MKTALAQPPLDGSLFLHQIPDFHRIHNPDHPCYTWQDPGAEQTHVLTYLEFSRGVHRAAGSTKHLEPGKPVAVIALCDTIVYHAIFLGLMKAGYVPYLISPRNSAPAVVKLLEDVNCHQVLATKVTLASLLSEVQHHLERKEYSIIVEEIAETQTLFPRLGQETSSDHFNAYESETPQNDLSDVAFYLHSSGSTGFPKTIPQTQQSILHWASFQCITDLRLHRPTLRIGATMLPSFHTLGIYFQLLVPLVALCVTNVAPPVYPSNGSLPYVPSPASALEHARATGCNSIITIPAILEVWASNPDSVAFLRGLSVVWFSGGTLSAPVGNELARSGVALTSVYGGTEFGAPSHTVPLAKDVADGDWMYIRFDSRANIRWVAHGDGLHEAVFLATEKHRPAVRNLAEEEGFATADLFERHPTKDLWKVVSRADDVLVLSSGEKVVPGPAEDIISSSSLVSTCMIFGREQHQVGLIVQPAQPIPSADPVKISEFKQGLHQIIEEANHINPAFARIFPHMVVVTEEGKPLVRNAKGAMHRKASLLAFEVEIANLYREAKSGHIDETMAPLRSGFTQAELSEWLCQQVSRLSNTEIRPDADLFEQGLDSLTVSSLRHQIISSPELGSVDQVTLDWIYEHPSIDAISAALFSPSLESSSITIQAMVDKYTLLLHPRIGGSVAVPTTPHAVILTGSTGTLGSQLLASLLGREQVGAIYCFNRPSNTGETLAERQDTAFRKQGLDVDVLKSTRVQLCLVDFTDSNMGLSSETVELIRSSAFDIIHSAWRLDFNLTLASFEAQIKATVNLLNFGSKCPGFHRFLFTSSVSSAQGWDSRNGLVPETVINDPVIARGQGYGEGKYVVERLLDISDVSSTSFRIGQVCGAPPLGAWPTTEWFPILVKTSIALKMFPQFRDLQTASWVPSSAATDTILDAVFAAPGNTPSTVNVVHPRPALWSDIANWVIKAVGNPELAKVDADEWVQALRRYEHDTASSRLEDMPALKLLPFFDALAVAPTSNEVGGLPSFSVSNPKLFALAPLGPTDIESWIHYWRSTGFIPTV